MGHVGGEPEGGAEDVPPDVFTDRRIAAEEGPQQVAAADDTDELPGLVGHGQPLHAFAVHGPGAGAEPTALAARGEGWFPEDEEGHGAAPPPDRAPCHPDPREADESFLALRARPQPRATDGPVGPTRDPPPGARAWGRATSHPRKAVATVERPLVVGVDGSDASLTAADWAVDEAVRHGQPLRIVHASLWERYEGTAPTWTVDRPAEQVFAENIVGVVAERALRRAPGLTVTTAVLAEDASSALLDEGREAASLVVGSRGRGALAGLLLGSVGLVVAARSHCPVVVVRGDRQALEARHERVLLGIGDHDVDAPAVRFAFREAAARHAELDVVRAWRRPASVPAGHPLLSGGGGLSFEERAFDVLDRALEPAVRDHPRVHLRRSAVEGPAYKVLVERSAAADLLVVGARRRDGVIGLELGRVAHRSLHHASCPVVVVPGHHHAPTDGDP